MTAGRTVNGGESAAFAPLGTRLVKGGSWAVGGRVITMAAGFVSAALLARLLSPDELGSYFLALSVVTLGSIFGSLGLNQVAVRFIAASLESRQPDIARTVVIRIALLGVGGAVAAGAAYALVGHRVGAALLNAPALGALSGLVAAWIVVQTVQNVLAEVFRGFHDIRGASIFGGAASSVFLLVGLAALWTLADGGSLPTVVLLGVGTFALSTAIGIRVIVGRVRNLPYKTAEPAPTAGELLWVGAPLLASNVTLFWFAQGPLWIVGASLPHDDVALYGLAMRIVALLGLPLLVMEGVLLPVIVEMLTSGRQRRLQRLLQAAATVSTLCVMLAALFLVIAGRPLLQIVYGDFYAAAAPTLTLLMLAPLANVATGICGHTLVMSGHQGRMMTISVLSATLMLGAAALAVRPFGINGVAVVVSLGTLFHNVLLLLTTHDRTGVWTHASIRAFRWAPELFHSPPHPSSRDLS